MTDDVHDRLARRTQELVRLGAVVGGRLVTEAGLPLSDARALRVLDEMRSAPVTPGLLSRELGLSPAAVTALVDRLVAAGLVERRPDPGDRRRVHLLLTEQARALAARILAPLARVIDERAAALDPPTAAAVTLYLEAVLSEAGRVEHRGGT